MADDLALEGEEYRDVPPPAHSLEHWDEVKAELEFQINALQRDTMCARCRKYFNLWDSMGRWECRKHEGGILEEDGYGNQRVWACCGKKQAEYRLGEMRGCVPCDHIVSSMDKSYETFSLRADLYQCMPVAQLGRAVRCKAVYNVYTGEYYKEKSFVEVQICEPRENRKQAPPKYDCFPTTNPWYNR